tara:strand:+ start:229 stop:1752 length:1524 start_codon:yes stop_codon:yes gene_type:complete
MTLDWPSIREVLFRWLLAMSVITMYFTVANLTCSGTRCGESVVGDLNLIGLVAIVAAGVWAGLNLMRTNTQLLFTPLVAYAMSTALFFGFGPMSTFLADAATIRFQADAVYAVTGVEVLRTNLLTSIGIAVSIVAILFVLPRQRVKVLERRELSIKTVALTFVISGLVLKHLVIMPSIYGTSDFLVPGILTNLGYLPDLGFALMAMIAASGDRKWQALFWLIWPWHLLLVFPEFSKKSVMLSLLLPALGAYSGHRSLKKLMTWVVSAMLLFAVLQNANTAGRWAVDTAEQRNLVLGVRERLEILSKTIFSDVGSDRYVPAAKADVEIWWLRLNYSGPQSKAMSLYDSGMAGVFTQNPLIYLVPRFIWPDKPVMASPGQAFHALVTDRPDTNTKVGITVFADGYRQMGWFGLAAFSAIMGGIMGMIARITMGQLGRRRYLFLPAAMLGLNMGATSTTQFFQNGIIAGLPVYFGYIILVQLLYSLLGNPNGNSKPAGRRRAGKLRAVRQ